jgi:dolichyl-phosphate-mannose--protein O-mannosyl transferase
MPIIWWIFIVNIHLFLVVKVHLVVFWKFGTSVLKEHTVTVFILEDGGRIFL